MKETFPPRPVKDPAHTFDPGLQKKFREEERAWFEKLAAHPHVQIAMQIPADEPVFWVRSQDMFSAETVNFWLSSAQRHVSIEKFKSAVMDYQAMLEWQQRNQDKTKIPD